MNKSKLNRIIQIQEKQIEELKKANRKLLATNCEECSKKRKAKYNGFLKRFNAWQNELDSIMNKYGGAKY